MNKFLLKHSLPIMMILGLLLIVSENKNYSIVCYTIVIILAVNYIRLKTTE